MSYLTNSKQYISIQDALSENNEILYCVPQESILGPKLPIIYISETCNISQTLGFTLIVNDTNIFFSDTILIIYAKALVENEALSMIGFV